MNHADTKLEEGKNEIATLAGGCFWCIEAIFNDKEGVEKAISGYAGGKKVNASYDKVKTGNTEHRESVQVHYDSSVISYREILNEFWRNIEPTDEGGQFSDRGFQYTTAIYYHNQNQKKIAEDTKANIGKKYEKPIATEIVKFTTFFPAEESHQNYSGKNPAHYKAYKKASGRSGFLKEAWNNLK